MVVVNKQTLIHWMLLDSLAKENYYREKIQIFQKKYNVTFEAFENKIETAEKESFEEWDDFIEWEAYEGFLSRLKERIHDIRNGNIQLAG
ncbi:MAG TPA: hypothetical protein PK079_06285 [Leptospiraceae bacterium]|nr:hypothetical protein [Leptospiraceae bacterium]HMX32053.1 hypothetical protein [Leptospiraceae bacterium]HMY31184.1 hypothetical protein [Leptospiraceae bacterium]HMZ65395.1 hypothetical protein [Leptospiraceae bacterium]HNA06067.1 hypothetical protein [Leptospiraceae bacterium]